MQKTHDESAQNKSGIAQFENRNTTQIENIRLSVWHFDNRDRL
jgi:hypothetical protein